MDKKSLASIHKKGQEKYDHNFTQKGRNNSYIEYYDNLFSEIDPDFHMKILEMGISYGGSLWLWKNYFSNYELHGLDILPSFVKDEKFDDMQLEITSDPNIHLHFGLNSRDVNSYMKLHEESKTYNYFNIIIDDADVNIESKLQTFQSTFGMLKPGGIYIMENIQHIMHTALIAQDIKRMSPASVIHSVVYNKSNDDIILQVFK